MNLRFVRWVIFIPRLRVYRSQSGHKGITWEFAPRWFLDCAVIFPLYLLQKPMLPFVLAFVSLHPPCLCMFLHLLKCRRAYLSLFQAFQLCLSRSGCDTVAANYRSQRLKAGEEGANHNLSWKLLFCFLTRCYCPRPDILTI